MVEEHSPEFVDAGEKQKIDFFDGDVHLGHYDFRFDFNDKKHFSISRDGTGRVRVHSQKNISKLWILLEDEDFRPIELRKYAETDRLIFGVLRYSSDQLQQSSALQQALMNSLIFI